VGRDGGDPVISVVCFQWNNGFRDYTPDRVNILARMLKAKCSFPHRFICVTDETDGFSEDVEVLPMPAAAQAMAKIKSPEGSRFPSSYRRLWAFSDEARCLGERILLLDIDCVITADLAPLLEPDADFVGWCPNYNWGPVGTKRVAGGTWLLRTGTHTEVWTDFNEAKAKEVRAKGFRGSDQAWLTYKLADNCVFWPKNAGIYQSQDMKPRRWTLPSDARIVHFNGDFKPWNKRNLPWVRKHYG
jgi:hypothetical protein